MSVLDIIKQRRSIRKYKNRPISQQELDQLLKAALLAPSSRSLYPLEYVVLQERDQIDALKNCKSAGTGALDTAPLAIVIIGDMEKSDVWIEDASIAATMIMLQAEDMGLSSCWIQMRLRKGQQESSEEEVKKLLGIPGNYGVLAVMALGRKDEGKVAYTDSDADFTKVHYHKY